MKTIESNSDQQCELRSALRVAKLVRRIIQALMIDRQGLAKLAEKYIANKTQNESSQLGINEAETRQQYIDPFLDLLGWDVRNSQGAPLHMQDVVVEQKIDSDRPDYILRVDGDLVLTIEAKKAALDILSSKESILQSRRYGFSLGHSYSVLTNFRHTLVLNCAKPPSLQDDIRSVIVKQISVEELADQEAAKWLSNNIAKEALLASTSPLIEIDSETISVDSRFVDDLAKWRLKIGNFLYQSITPSPSIDDIEKDVRRMVDQIVFLRVAEAKSGQDFLKSILSPGFDFQGYHALLSRSRQVFNSELFNNIPILPGKLDEAKKAQFSFVLKNVVSEMYPPLCPYEFSLVPQDILSQAYERFLGATLCLSSSSRGLAEVKSGERRKNFGIYYTQNFVARYITSRAMEEVVSKRDYKIVRPKTNPTIIFNKPLRILDPACGSGTFLAEAYQWLLDWYLSTYLSSPEVQEILRFSIAQRPKGIILPVERDHRNEYGLTIVERRRILEEHIFGIDIDKEACETTRLTLGIQLVSSLHILQFSTDDPILPNLANNIVCGNTLVLDSEIAPCLGKVDDETLIRLNPMQNEINGIKFDGPSFDVIIGNPPYRRERDYKLLHDDARITEWGQDKYVMRMDLWFYFVHRSLELLAEGGVLSFIVNSYFIGSAGSKKMLLSLYESGCLLEILDLCDLKVFKDVAGRHLIFRFIKVSPTKKEQEQIHTKYLQVPGNLIAKHPKVAFQQINVLPCVDALSTDVLRTDALVLPQIQNRDVSVNVSSRSIENSLPSLPLEEIALVRQGIAENPSRLTAADVRKYCPSCAPGEGVFQLTYNEIVNLGLAGYLQEFIFPYHTTSEISEYRVEPDPPYYIIYSTASTVSDINDYPNLKAHLSRFRDKLENRREVQNGARRWWHLHWPRDPEIWGAPKIISVNMGVKPPFAYSYGFTLTPFSTNLILPQNPAYSLEFLTGILNSDAAFNWFKRHAKKRGAGVEINGGHLRLMPLPDIDRLEKTQRDAVKEVEVLVARVHEQLKDGCIGIDELPARAVVSAINEVITTSFGRLYEN